MSPWHDRLRRIEQVGDFCKVQVGIGTEDCRQRAGDGWRLRQDDGARARFSKLLPVTCVAQEADVARLRALQRGDPTDEGAARSSERPAKPGHDAGQQNPGRGAGLTIFVSHCVPLCFEAGPPSLERLSELEGESLGAVVRLVVQRNGKVDLHRAEGRDPR